MGLKNKVIDLLEIAKYAPSGGNLQPWKVYMMENIDSIKLIICIDKQMEIGQYVDLGMFIQNIKLLSSESGLNYSQIKFFNPTHSNSNTSSTIRELLKIPLHEIMVCSFLIKQGIQKQSKKKEICTEFIIVPKL